MVKFAHFADCHIGGWRQPELSALNFKSFQKAVELALKEDIEFILIAGDLFDSAYPPIEILKDTFAEFRKIKEASIPVFIIAGSHDYSTSGKTFLDVLEKSGFCTSIDKYEKGEDGRIKLFPTKFNDIFMLGYPGRKSGMEVEDLKKVYFESIYPFTIFAFHSTIKDVVGNIPMDSINKEDLPIANYYAMGHIHQRFETTFRNSMFVYPGPTFPNNFQELADLKYGSFSIVDIDGSKIKHRNILVPIKEVVYQEIEITDALSATNKIINIIDKININDKIFLLKLYGTINSGKSGDIKFDEIENFVQKKGAYTFLRNISSLASKDIDTDLNIEDKGHIEEISIEEYVKKNPTEFDCFISPLMHSLSIEKNEDEKDAIYETRLIDDLKKVLNLEEVL